jgi:hypothetical protein
MKVSVSINPRKRKLFERVLSGILPLSYQVDIFSNHSGIESRYEIPYETDKQKRTILNVEKIMK